MFIDRGVLDNPLCMRDERCVKPLLDDSGQLDDSVCVLDDA